MTITIGDAIATLLEKFPDGLAVTPNGEIRTLNGLAWLYEHTGERTLPWTGEQRQRLAEADAAVARGEWIDEADATDLPADFTHEQFLALVERRRQREQDQASEQELRYVIL